MDEILSDAGKNALWKILGQSVDEEPRDVFKVLDGARVPQLLEYLTRHEAEFACLFSAETDPVKLVQAPYLVRVEQGSDVAAWLASSGWGQSWGIYVLAPRGTDLDTMSRDMREALHARLPDRRVVLFRFFDPRVWRPFFPTCDALQLRMLFGRTISAFACEGESGDAVLLDTVDARGPRRKSIILPHD